MLRCMGTYFSVISRDVLQRGLVHEESLLSTGSSWPSVDLTACLEEKIIRDVVEEAKKLLQNHANLQPVAKMVEKYRGTLGDSVTEASPETGLN
jgi:hypothetical protein